MWLLFRSGFKPSLLKRKKVRQCDALCVRVPWYWYPWQPSSSEVKLNSFACAFHCSTNSVFVFAQLLFFYFHTLFLFICKNYIFYLHKFCFICAQFLFFYLRKFCFAFAQILFYICVNSVFHLHKFCLFIGTNSVLYLHNFFFYLHILFLFTHFF